MLNPLKRKEKNNIIYNQNNELKFLSSKNKSTHASILLF